MTKTVKEFLTGQKGEWFSPKQVAHYLDIHIISAYNALRMLVINDPTNFQRKYEDRNVYYRHSPKRGGKS